MKMLIKSIIINFPTNLGDTFLALPVLDAVRHNHLYAKITAIASINTKDFFLRSNSIDEVVLFDKLWKLRVKLRFALSLRGEYDLMIDLKNSFLPIILGTRRRTPFVRNFPKNLHIKTKYLNLIKKFISQEGPIGDFSLTPDEKKKWEDLNLSSSIFIACSSLSPLKQYPYEYLKKVVECLAEKHSVIIIGQEKERSFYKDILFLKGVTDLVGKTQITDVFFLLKNYAKMILGVDSSILHLASYLNLPIVGLFGPTHPDRSRPYSDNSIVLRKETLSCIACEDVKCSIDHECMKIPPGKVVNAIEQILECPSGHLPIK